MLLDDIRYVKIVSWHKRFVDGAKFVWQYLFPFLVMTLRSKQKKWRVKSIPHFYWHHFVKLYFVSFVIGMALCKYKNNID